MFDTKSQNCHFAEQTVDFLYGELEAENQAAFSVHLRECAACAQELAGFKTVRSSIDEWRALEFDQLESPKIEIEYERENQARTITANAPETDSWFAGIRGIFTFSPAFAAVAAILVLAVGAILISTKFGGERQTAELNNKENQRQANASDAGQNGNSITNFENNSRAEKPSVAAASPASDIIDNKNVSTPKARAVGGESKTVKVSGGERAVVIKNSIAQRANSSPFQSKTVVSNADIARNVPTPKAPRALKLSSIEDDDEENSLRLADLLDDAGGK